MPAAENAKGRGKAGRSRRLASRYAPVSMLALAMVPSAQAAPTGGQVVSGTGKISQSGNVTDINQASQNLSLNWQTFNVSAQETVNFLQPSASAVAVNRIVGGSGSQILGHLNANGQVYLINPDGIVFGKGAEVNVGGLVASTLDMTDPSFVGSEKSFSGEAAGAVLNQGTIDAASGGYVALLGNRVGNQGVITARLGTVALGGGTAMTLTFAGNSLVHLQVDRSAINSAVSNGGFIRADGGQVVMTAGAKDALLASVVNNTGVIEARTVDNHNGVITLLAGMSDGTVNVGGSLDASAPEGGNGGRIETSGARVTVSDNARVTTAASAGRYGSWLIDPQDFTVAPSGGDITGATLSSELNTTSVTLQSSNGQATGSGNVNVNDAVAWSANTALTLTASNNVNVNSTISATGAFASLVINPNTANGSEVASGTGVFNLGAGATINLPNVAPTSSTALVIAGTPYTVLNTLGFAGSTSGTDLQGISGNVSGHYALGSNIDASATSSWNSGAGFTPIGTSSAPFAGTFDGLGHSIGNLTINLPTTNYVGLFANTGSASIVRNVGLVGGSVTGANYVGALVGNNYGGAISNTYSTGRVTGASYVGGLVGYTFRGSIDTSYTSGAVSGSTNVGGLIGYDHGSVTNSYATGAVSGTTDVGGLAGYLYGNYQVIGTVSNSYATGNVSGSSNVGGLVGAVGGTYGGSASGSATGNVTGGSSVGGLVGAVGGGGNINFGFAGSAGGTASGNVSGGVDVGGLVGSNGGSVSGTASGNVSGLSAVGGLIGSNGGGWSGNYRTAGTLGAASGTASGNVSGTSDVGGLVGINGGASGFYGLVGTISGGHATGNVNGTGNNVGGLVGYNYGTISASSATGNVKGVNYVGGLLGSSVAPYNPDQTPIISVTNSFATGSVNGVGYVGGLAGSMEGSPIVSSYATGNVAGTASYVGGLVGFVGYGGASASANPISNSYATGNVSGVSDVGGLIGHLDFIGYDATIINTYATGNVVGSSNVGGLVGDEAYNGTTAASISNSYSAGRVSGSSNVGGLVGQNGGFVANSFWDTTTSGQKLSAGGIGLTTPQMQTEANYVSPTAANGNVNPGWDFASTWVVYNGNTYPLLASYMTPITVTPNSGSLTYNGSAYAGSLGVTYSSTPNGNLLGTLAFNAPQGAVNVGTYTLTPSGLYSNQQGYIISYGTGTLTINQLANVAWVGGTSGLWSNASNWAGGALPDYSNVAAVTIPKGVTVTYDAGVSGATKLTSLTSNGNLNLAAGSLSTTGSLSTVGYDQTGGALTVGGTLSIASTAGAVSLGNIAAGSLKVNSTAGAITQIASTAVDVTGASTVIADNGITGAGDVKYGISLGSVKNRFGGAVSSNGSAISLADGTGGLTLGNTTATGSTTIVSRGGAVTQLGGTYLSVVGTTTVTADNGAAGPGGVEYGVTLANTANNFGGSVSLTGSNVSIADATGGLVLGNTQAGGTFAAISRGGAISQATGAELGVTGTSTLTADNGVSGGGDTRYAITVADSANKLSGVVSVEGSNVSLSDSAGGLALGNTSVSGSLVAVSRGGSISQVSGSKLTVTGASTLTADNGVSGAGEVKYSVSVANSANDFAGAVALNGSNVSISDGAGGLLLGNTTASGTFNATVEQGAMTQVAGTAINVAGAAKLVGDNGASGASDVRHSITLANAGNNFVGAVSATGSNVSLNDGSGGLILGNTSATGTLTATSRGGALTEANNAILSVAGASTLTADNGASGQSDVKYGVTFTSSANHFTGAVAATGSAVSLANAQALTAKVTSTGTASLAAAGKMAVSGSVGTNLTTVTTGGSASTTTFGTTSVGDYLNVTSPGAVTTASATTDLTVDGAGTTTYNSHVTVNKVVGAIIK